MADIEGGNGDDTLNGNGAGESDTIRGGRGNDSLSGQSGDDFLGGGRGNDVLTGGSGSDVMEGGLDSDTFRFSAGHIQADAIDWITDFSFTQNDGLQFLTSASGSIEILSATATFVDNQSFNGFDLSNSANGRELILEVRNTGNGNVQQIVLVDSFSNSNSAQWQAYLTSLGFTGTIDANTDTVTL